MTAAVRSLSLKIRRCRGGLAGCLAVLLAGCLALAGQPVLAQSVEDQLQRLQRELSDLQSQVYRGDTPPAAAEAGARSEEHTSELQSLMRISYAVFCLKKKTNKPDKHQVTDS